MQITKNHVVGFYYTIKDTDGNVLESILDGEPQVYMHGARNILPMLEQGLEGKAEGEQVTIALDMLDAYGPHKEDLVQRMPVKHLQPVQGKRLKAGEAAIVQTKQGARRLTITKLGKFQATVDANHPMAGKDLEFDITINKVREATEEELAHGHAHGLDGSHSH